MQKNTGKGTGTNKKQDDFDSAFAKFASKLNKDYTEQFKRPDNKGPSKETKIKEAMRMGKKIEVVQKSAGNKAHAQNLNVAKLLEDEHPIEIKEYPKEIASQVARFRAEKKLTQEQLATKIMEKASIINDLERASGVYDPQVISKIEKALGVKIDRPWKHK
jgi:putative transcription factor